MVSAGAALHWAIWNRVVERPATPAVDGAPPGGAELITSTFAARLNVAGQSYNQTFEMKLDPRVKA